MNSFSMTPIGRSVLGFFWGVGLLILPFGLQAQTTYTTALSPNPLENLGHSPRAYALGEAFAAVSGDPACLFYNPAGLAGIPALQVSAMHQDWIAGISQETLLAGFPAGQAGSFALGANYLNYGALESYDASGNPTSSNSPFRGSLYAGWGGPILSGISLGLSAHGAIQSLAPGASKLSSAVQAGALWKPIPRLSLGGAYTFLNTDSDLGLGFLELGASYSIFLFFQSSTLLEMGFSLPLYNVARLQFGAEQPFLNFLVVRAGYQLELDNNDIAGFRGLTGGLGLDLDDFSLDYAYSPDGDLGSSQMISLAYRLPTESKPAPNPHPQNTWAVPVSVIPSPAASVAATPTPNATPVLKPEETATPTATASPTTTWTPSAGSNGEPSPTPTLVSMDFNPSSTALPSDKVQKVETRFQIPDTVDSPASASVTPSPEMEKALEEAGQKVGQNPQDPQAWMNLGNLYWELDQPDYALQCFSEVLRLKPGATALRDWVSRYYKAHPDKAPME